MEVDYPENEHDAQGNEDDAGDDYDEEEEDDDSDDGAGLLKPAFDLQALKIQEDAIQGGKSKTVNLDGPPSDGLEYLLQVRKEARSVPNVIVARSIRSVPETTGIVTVCTTERRTVGEVQRKQIASFGTARQMMLDARLSQISKTSSSVPMQNDYDDEEESDDDRGENDSNGDMETEEEKSRKQSKQFITMFDKLEIDRKLPLITTMLAIDQDDLSELLDEFAEKISELPQNENFNAEITSSSAESSWTLGRWIFSSLAAVDEPASAENLAAMRNLAKNCLQTGVVLKQKANNNPFLESVLVDLDLFLLIVVIHFKQRDLLEIVNVD